MGQDSCCILVQESYLSEWWVSSWARLIRASVLAICPASLVGWPLRLFVYCLLERKPSVLLIRACHSNRHAIAGGVAFPPVRADFIPPPAPLQPTQPLSPPPPPPQSPLKQPSSTVTPPPEQCSTPPEYTMPLRFVDPEPFMPRGFMRVLVDGRRLVSHAILGRQTRLNNDLANITIDPVPNHQVSFTGIRNVLDDFLHHHLRIGYRTIQPCSFGQAYVCFDFYHDRDRLIHDSPHDFGNVRISFVEPDKGWNHKRVTMNYEVWLMFLGFNVDHWNNRLVDKALSGWGSLVTWEEDPKCLARILVKAKVVALDEIP